MPFDVEGARKAGYSDSEIADFMGRDSGFDAAGARRSGYSDAEIITHLRPAAGSFAAKPTPRQQYLASAPVRWARGGKDGIDAGAQVLQHVASDGNLNTLNKAADAVGGFLNQHVFNTPTFNRLIGAPEDYKGDFAGEVLGIRGMTRDQLTADVRGANQQVDEARRATGQVDPKTGEPTVDGMRLLGNVTGPVGLTVGRLVPGSPIASGVARTARTGAVAGAVGGATQPVTGDNFAAEKLGQVALGAAGGAVLGPVVSKLGESLGRLVDRWRSSTRTVNVTPERLQELVRRQLADDGIDATTIPDQVFSRLGDEVKAALASGKKLDLAAALRKQDFDALGLPATRGQLTRNPMQWQREVNMAGVDGIGEPLQQVFQRQTRGIDSRLGAMARGAGEPFDAGAQMIDLAQAGQKVRDGNVRAAYDTFRSATGRDLEVPLQGLAQDYAEAVQTFGEAIPAAVRKQFEGLGLMSGTQRRGLTIDGAEQLIKVLNANANPADKPAMRALGQLRGALERAITQSADTSGEGAMAAQLAKEARGFAADNFRNLAATPGLRAAVEGMEPDQFVQRYVITGKVNEIERLGEAMGPEGRQIMAAQMARHLQQKAFGPNVAGDGKAAANAFSAELVRIGRPKLVALFGEDGTNELLQLSRVLSYMKQVPEGATPNTSGTGQMIASLVGKARGAASTIGGLPWVHDVITKPLTTGAQRMQASAALKPVPQAAADLDPATVQAISRLFAPAPFALGVAAGK
ncbi:MAG: hypothetical protein KBC73_13150 [Burkholderiaceae bacterium]|nr:hypothetical protein [Burkholderiaceae bacterium]